MDRKHFLKLMAILPFASQAMNLKSLNKLSDALPNTEKMPVLFLGHGSPMNAIEENVFVQGFKKAGKDLEKPKAILCISAHWETKGTYVTAMQQPRTIHDFGGFPKALYQVQYTAPGNPELAKLTSELLAPTDVGMDQAWGLDHGAWSVIKHMYPNADVPVIQMSLDHTKDASYHFELAKKLHALRNKGVLIIGSGNMVHNLGLVNWQKLNEQFAFDWALEADQKMKSIMLTDNFKKLVDYKSQGKAFQLAIPTPEHYLPLLYVLALKNDKEELSFFNDKPVAGSITMTSVKIGAA